MFRHFLFLALGILDEQGNGKHLTRHEAAPAHSSDWFRYLDELFLCNRNLDALAQSVRLSSAPGVDVWIGLPYPNPQVFSSEARRIAAVHAWIEACLTMWCRSHFYPALRLRGFYWLQESLYYTGPEVDDRRLIRAVNRLIHRLRADGKPLTSIWIPYQGANGWDEWRELGFDLAFLQPNYYFQPEKRLETAAANAWQQQMGLEMEFDLAVTYDSLRRARWLEYMRLGATGGQAADGRPFGPYMLDAPLAWYTGGWYLGKNGRKQALVSLAHDRDPLYAQICRFFHGTYNSNEPS